MATILKVEGMVNHGNYANVHVILDDGTEAEIYIGGGVECFFHRGKVKAFVKKPLTNSKRLGTL